MASPSPPPKFAGVVEVPPRAPAETLVAEAVEMKNDIERMIVDSGCKRSVAGRRWHRRMHVILYTQGLKPQRRTIKEVFRFGDGLLSHSSSVVYVYPVGIYSTHGTVGAAMVQQCPPLLSNKAMKELGVAMGWSEDTITVRAAQAYDQPMELLPSGHPSLVVTDYDKECEVSGRVLALGLRDWL